MAFVDEFGNYMTPKYNREQALVGAGMTPAQISQQYAGAQEQSGSTAPWASYGGYSAAPPAWKPGSSVVPTDEQFAQFILSSPEYKQGMETAEGAFKLEGDYAGKTSKIQNDMYGAQETDAARAKAMNDKRIREVMASRGILSSGQTQFELNNADYDYKAFLRDLMFQKSMREATDVYGGEKRTQQLQSARYQTYRTVSQLYRNLWWDPATNRYRGQVGG